MAVDTGGRPGVPTRLVQRGAQEVGREGLIECAAGGRPWWAMRHERGRQCVQVVAVTGSLELMVGPLMGWRSESRVRMSRRACPAPCRLEQANKSRGS